MERTKEENDKKYICRERANKCFCRQFVVHNIDGNAIQASLTDGVLEVKLPKQDKQQIEKNHRIEIK
jgi:HSP20 family protein